MLIMLTNSNSLFKMDKIWIELPRYKMWYNYRTKQLIEEENMDMKMIDEVDETLKDSPEFTMDVPGKVPADMKQPLTHWHNFYQEYQEVCHHNSNISWNRVGNVAKQVKDCDLEYRMYVVMNFTAERAIKKLYLKNFSLIKKETFYTMLKIPELIKKLWVRHLKASGLSHNPEEFFDDHEVDGYVDDMRYRIWELKLEDETLEFVDINGWPGDNESGTIFVKVGEEYKAIYGNGDTNLSPLNDCDLKYLRLLPSFQGIRQREPEVEE